LKQYGQHDQGPSRSYDQGPSKSYEQGQPKSYAHHDQGGYYADGGDENRRYEAGDGDVVVDLGKEGYVGGLVFVWESETLMDLFFSPFFVLPTWYYLLIPPRPHPSRQRSMTPPDKGKGLEYVTQDVPNQYTGTTA
jgi:hypothetical protein